MEDPFSLGYKDSDPIAISCDLSVGYGITGSPPNEMSWSDKTKGADHGRLVISVGLGIVLMYVAYIRGGWYGVLLGALIQLPPCH